jgi:anti-sigma factor RsiW
MDRDDLEFLISQYVDGGLGGGKREALEARLKLDPSARAVLADFRALDANLKGLPLPDVRWEALATRISNAVANAEEPARSYRISDYRWTRWGAVAAAVLIAAGTAFVTLRDRGPRTIAIGPSTPVGTQVAKVIVIGPDASTEVAPVSAPVLVAIGPSDRLPKQAAYNRYASEVITRPSQVLIASTARPAQDIGLSPF